MSSHFFLLMLVFYGSYESLATNPGFRIAITSKGLDYILTVGIPILENALSTANIPDISGDAGTPIGTVEYSLSSIKLSPLSIPTSSLTSGDKGLQLQASSISISLHANWHYKEKSFPNIEDSGSCDVSVSSVSLSVGVSLGVDSNGHPTLSATGCSVHIGNLDIHFHGGASWLYNLFSDSIADSLKGSLQDQLCDEAVKEINTDGNKALETLPIEVKVDDYSTVNYALIEAPIFTSTYVATNHKGEFISNTNPVESPMIPAPLPAISSTDRMMYVWFTDYVANTAGAVYQAAGVLSYNVTPDMIPDSSPIQLNTTSFRLIIPQLYKTYPNMSMTLNLHAPKPPTMAISSESVNFTVPCYANFSVIDPTTKLPKPAFTLGIIIHCNMKLWVHANGSKEVISGNAAFLKADLSLVSSSVGKINVLLLQTTADVLSKSIIIPLLNNYANPGIEIPTFDGISFLNANITLGDHYVMVSTDVNYKPTFV